MRQAAQSGLDSNYNVVEGGFITSFTGPVREPRQERGAGSPTWPPHRAKSARRGPRGAHPRALVTGEGCAPGGAAPFAATRKQVMKSLLRSVAAHVPDDAVKQTARAPRMMRCGRPFHGGEVVVRAARLVPRKAVEGMAPYSPPTAGREGHLRLDFNENTVGCSPQVLRILKRALSREKLAIYPEYGETRQRVAAFFGVPAGQLLFTNGTDEAIQVLINTFVDGGDRVLLLAPSYAMYRFYAEVAGATIAEVRYRAADLAFPLEELLEALTSETRAVLIANPNNPTGTAIDLAAIRRILENAENAAVLIDEAYFEFFGTTALGLLLEHPNLFVSRTFSKAYGMAGLRLGCVFSQAENILWLHKAQSPYSVNAVAMLAASAAVDDREYIQSYAAEALESRRLLCRAFDRMKVPYYPSSANFVLARFGDRSIEIRDRLREKGVLVRDRSYEIPGCIRVTVGRKVQLRQFLVALKDILG